MSWSTVRMDNLKSSGRYSFVGGPFGSELTTKDYVNEGVPVIRGSNLSGLGKFHHDNFVFVSEEKAAALQSNLAYPGDLIFTQRGTLGQVGLIPKDARFDRYVVSQSQMKLTVDENQISPLFVYYYFCLPSTIQQILNSVSTSGVPHINLSTLKAFQVPVPPRPIQDSIIGLVKPYDDLIENNRRRIALLEEAARLLYREWFVYFRFPGHEHVEMTDGLPEGWERRAIKDMTAFLGRGISPSYDDEADYASSNQKCVRNRMLSLAPARRQKKEFKPDKTLGFLDVLINSTGTGTLGRVAQCWSDPSSTTFDSHITVARPNETVDPYWFGYALLELESVFEGMGDGATNKKELGRTRIANTRVISSPQPLQRDFGLFASETTKQIQVLADQNERLAQARDLLVPRLMNGEIAV